MTPTCSTCTHYESHPTTIGGREFVAEFCTRMKTLTALARMAWTDMKGLPSAAEHCGPKGRFYVARGA